MNERSETGRLPVAEVFGPTFQGEGPYAGRLASFVRLGGCNLTCTWCDTAYTWDATRYDLRHEIKQVPVGEVLERLDGGPRLVVLTGGEPLLYAHLPAFATLVRTLRASGRSVHVETNGTIAPSVAVAEQIDVFVISPKLGNSGPHRANARPTLDPDWRTIAATSETHLKYVCSEIEDVEVARQHVENLEWQATSRWVMPEGSDPETARIHLARIADAAINHGFNVTARLHVIAWGNQRGR